MNSIEWTTITNRYASASYIDSSREAIWQKEEYYLSNNDEWKDWTLIKMGSTKFYWFRHACSKIVPLDVNSGIETDCIVSKCPELFFQIHKIKLKDITDRYDSYMNEILSTGKLKTLPVSYIVASEFDISIEIVNDCISYRSLKSSKDTGRLTDFQLNRINELQIKLETVGISLVNAH